MAQRVPFDFALAEPIEPDDYDDPPEAHDAEREEEPPRGRHMMGCIFIGGGWDCDGACPEAAAALAQDRPPKASP